jgi:hypothetical protein
MTRSWKTLAVLVATIITALVLSATALAAFGRQSNAEPRWRTTLSSGARALYPGGPGEYLQVVVANDSQASHTLRSIAALIAAEPNGDAETAAGADIPGCMARWFSATVDATNQTLGPGGTYTGTVDLTMPGSATNQDACRNASPAVVVTAS